MTGTYISSGSRHPGLHA